MSNNSEIASEHAPKPSAIEWSLIRTYTRHGCQNRLRRCAQRHNSKVPSSNGQGDPVRPPARPRDGPAWGRVSMSVSTIAAASPNSHADSMQYSNRPLVLIRLAHDFAHQSDIVVLIGQLIAALPALFAAFGVETG